MNVKKFSILLYCGNALECAVEMWKFLFRFAEMWPKNQLSAFRNFNLPIGEILPRRKTHLLIPV